MAARKRLSWAERAANNAALRSYLAILKWARENGCPDEEWLDEYLAKSSRTLVQGLLFTEVGNRAWILP